MAAPNTGEAPTLDTLRRNGKLELLDFHDPNMAVVDKPRKPLHAYLFFVKNMRNATKLANPNITFRELSILLAERWKSLDTYERAEYELLATEDRRITEKQVAKYHEFLQHNPSAAYQQGKKYKRKYQK